MKLSHIEQKLLLHVLDNACGILQKLAENQLGLNL